MNEGHPMSHGAEFWRKAAAAANIESQVKYPELPSTTGLTGGIVAPPGFLSGQQPSGSTSGHPFIPAWPSGGPPSGPPPFGGLLDFHLLKNLLRHLQEDLRRRPVLLLLQEDLLLHPTSTFFMSTLMTSYSGK